MLLSNELEKFRELFPSKSESWFKRCIKRLSSIYKLDRNTWFIRGISSLGDRRQYYIVTYNPGNKKYSCTCYDIFSPGGSRRRRETCSHVGAVILYEMISQKRLDLNENFSRE